MKKTEIKQHPSEEHIKSVSAQSEMIYGHLSPTFNDIFHNGFREGQQWQWEADNPPRKPLSELHLDREACEKIWHAITGETVEISIFNEGNFLEMKGQDGDGFWHEVNIWYDGDIFYSIKDGSQLTPHPFYLVNTIRSLGYDSENQ